MDKILFLNACIRPASRTYELAKALLARLGGEVSEVRLEDAPPMLNLQRLEQRSRAAEENDFSDGVFDAAREFALADVIVVAAPYWDLMFPAVLKAYLESITVCGITFCYSPEGRPKSLCRVRKLYYVTTAGGFIGENDFGFSYVRALARNFFGIGEIFRYSAEGLDIFGADAEGIMSKAKAEITKDFPLLEP